MKKASLFASAAVASVALSAAPAFAQGGAQGGGPFADVPTDHWAYSSVDRLQREGIVIGYPDGTYGGRRAMTRYEFAVAIARLLEKLPTGGGGTEGLVTRADLDRAIAGLATKEEVDQIRRLVNEFQNELTTLGVDLDAAKRRIDALETRVGLIEQEMKRVKISGAVNLMARTNLRRDDNEFLDHDGYTIRAPRSRTGLFGDAVNTFAESRVLHDIDLDINARLSETATARLKLNFGNYLPFLTSVSSFAGSRSTAVGPVNQSQQQTVYMAMVEAPVRLPGVGGVNLSAGRIPVQFTPYTLKLIDVDSYFNNDKTDLGDIPVDGVKGVFKLGPVGITAFAAKVDPIKYVSNINGELGPDQPGGYSLFAGAGFSPFQGGGFVGGSRPHQSSISPEANGAMAVENIAALRATIGTSRFGTFGATFMGLGGTPSTGGPTGNPFNLSDFDRVYVWGADLNGQLGPVGVNASFTESVTSGQGRDAFQNEIFRDEDNTAIDVALSFSTGALSLAGGFREIDPFFAAPGYWGKLGSWTNPVDITGPYVRASYALGSGLTLFGEGHFYEGTGDTATLATGGATGLDEDDKIRNFKLGLKYGLTSASAVDLGAEWTEYDVLRAGGPIGSRGKPREIFYNIGYGFSFNPSTSLKFLYQVVDYDDKGTGFDPTSGDGSVAAAQFSIKF